MEHIDLSTLSDEQLQMHADRARNDHFHCAKRDNRPGMIAALAEYYRVRTEQAGRRVSHLRMERASLNEVADAERAEAMSVAQMAHWSAVAERDHGVSV
ncbi:hypothetical protein M1D97_10445 [Kushneria sp. AK178]